MPKTTVSLALDLDVLNVLVAEARAKGVSTSKIANDVLVEYVQRKKRKRSGRVATLDDDDAYTDT
jgi:hypothetical protein